MNQADHRTEAQARCKILASHAIGLDPGAERGNYYEAGCARVCQGLIQRQLLSETRAQWRDLDFRAVTHNYRTVHLSE